METEGSLPALPPDALPAMNVGRLSKLASVSSPPVRRPWCFSPLCSLLHRLIHS